MWEYGCDFQSWRRCYKISLQNQAELWYFEGSRWPTECWESKEWNKVKSIQDGTGQLHPVPDDKVITCCQSRGRWLWSKVITTDVLEEQKLTQDLKEHWAASENVEEKLPGKFRKRQWLMDSGIFSFAIRSTCGHSVTLNHNNNNNTSSSSNNSTSLYLLNTIFRHWSEIHWYGF